MKIVTTRQFYFLEKGNIHKLAHFLEQWLELKPIHEANNDKGELMGSVFRMGSVDHFFFEKSDDSTNSAQKVNGSTNTIRIIVESKEDVEQLHAKAIELGLTPLSNPRENKHDNEYFQSINFVVQDEFKQWWHVATPFTLVLPMED